MKMTYCGVCTVLCPRCERSDTGERGGGRKSRVSSRNFILGRKLTDHVAVRPPRGEGRLHNYRGGGGGEVGSVWGRKLSCLGGGGGESFPCTPLLR